jgi:hypothetical protein
LGFTSNSYTGDDDGVYTTSYTVHFAGHEVPTYKPKEANVLFNAFINNDYTSLLTATANA